MTDQIPQAIAAVVDNLNADLPDAEVELEQLAPDRWRITATSPRVRMWVEYKPLSRGRLLFKNSKLFIDDEPAVRAGSYAELVNIYRNPDQPGTEEKPAAQRVADAVPAEESEAPALVIETYRMVGSRKLAGTQVVLRRDGSHWLVCMENERVQLVMLFAEMSMNPNRPLRDRPVGQAPGGWLYLAVDGNDLSDKAQNLQKALTVASAHLASPPAPAVARESGVGTMATSVQVRKTVVIRN